MKNHSLKPVIDGGVEIKQKSKLKSAVSEYVNDNVNELKDHVIKDVLVPGILGGIQDALIGFIEGIFGCRSNRSRSSYGRSSLGGRISWIDYSGYSSRPKSEPKPASNPGILALDDIGFDSIAKANAVLDALTDAIEMYKFVTVSDLYDILGLTCPYTYESYGWVDLSMARIDRISGNSQYKYRLVLPKARPIT